MSSGTKVRRGEPCEPWGGDLAANAVAGLRYSLARPVLVAQVEQPEVDQPFARVVHDIDVQPARRHRAAQRTFGPELDCHAKLTEAACARRPLGRISLEGSQMFL